MHHPSRPVEGLLGRRGRKAALVKSWNLSMQLAALVRAHRSLHCLDLRSTYLL
jgi:hypothetical protein